MASEEIARTEMGRLVINKGLDKTFDDAWEWYREVYLKGDPSTVLREHVIAISRACDDIVRALYPERIPYYLDLAHRRISLLDEHVEKSAQR